MYIVSADIIYVFQTILMYITYYIYMYLDMVNIFVFAKQTIYQNSICKQFVQAGAFSTSTCEL